MRSITIHVSLFFKTISKITPHCINESELLLRPPLFPYARPPSTILNFDKQNKYSIYRGKLPHPMAPKKAPGTPNYRQLPRVPRHRGGIAMATNFKTPFSRKLYPKRANFSLHLFLIFPLVKV